MLDDTTTGLVRFLLQRIDDEDDRLRVELRRHQRLHPGSSDPVGRNALLQQQADNADRRTRVGEAQRTLLLRDLPGQRPEREHAAEVLRSLAGRHDGHRAYRHEWRPEQAA